MKPETFSTETEEGLPPPAYEGSEHPADNSTDPPAQQIEEPVPKGDTENDLKLLEEYDTVFIVDDSGSMKGRLWDEVSDAFSLAPDRVRDY